jgi:hypothetical protein
MTEKSNKNTVTSSWKTVYRIAALAALAMVLVFRRFFGAELMLSDGFGIFNVPETDPVRAIEWFELLQREPFVGLTLLGLFDLVNYALLGVFFLALYGALRGSADGVVLLATFLGWAGIVVYFASNQAFGLLHLSRQYTSLPPEGQTELLTAGEALLAIHRGTVGFLSFGLVLLAGLFFSIVMLRDRTFGRWTAIAGILSNGIALGTFPMLLFAPAILWLPPSFSAPFRLLWYLLAAWRLFRLGKGH